MSGPTHIVFLLGAPAFHPVEAQARRIAGWLGPDDYRYHYLEGKDALEPAVLDNCGLLVLMGLHWSGLPHIRRPMPYVPLEDRHKQAFEAYVRSGRPIIIHHGASGCYDDWPRFGELLGLTWEWGVTKHSPIHELDIRLTDRAHPITRGVDDFQLTDEAYYDIKVMPGVEPRVLASTRYDGRELPMIFALEGEGGRAPGAGRLAYLVNGHDMGVFEHPMMQRLWRNTVSWALETPEDETRAPYRAAVIGCGESGERKDKKAGGFGIGYWHADAFRGHPRVALSMAADISRPNLDAFAQKYKLPEAGRYEDYRRMLDEAWPDLVSIGTHLGLHREMIEAAAESGVKGIICEKPLAASPVELDAVRGVVERTGVKMVVAHVRRYCEGFRRARQLIDEGAIGRPVLFFAGIEGWDLAEWGSHWLDMFRFLRHDRPVSWVMGQARVRETRGYGHAMEDHAIAYYQFDDGVKALLDGGHAFHSDEAPMHMTLTGTTGTLRIYGHAGHRLVLQNASGQAEERFEQPFTETWDRLVTDLVSWIEGGPEPCTSLNAVAPSSEINLAAYLSSLRRDRIDLPLEDDTDEWPVETLARVRYQQQSIAAV